MWGQRLLVNAAAIVVIVAGLRAAEPLIVPLVFAAFLTTLSAPVLIRLKQRRVPMAVGVPLVLLVLSLVLGGVAALVGGSVNLFLAALPRYQKSLEGQLAAAVQWVDSQSWLLQGRHLSQEAVLDLFNTQSIFNLAAETMRQVASVLSDTVMIGLTVAFMLFEVAGLRDKLMRVLRHPDKDIRELEKVATEVNRYVVIKTYISLGTGCTIGLFTAFLGLDFPMLWGLLGFLLNYVPNIGSVMAAIPSVLLALVQLGPASALVTLLGYALINVVIGNVVEPRLMGRKLGLSTLIVWLSLLFWGWLWGPIGMLLSVPLTMILKIWLEHNPEFRSTAALMDPPRPGSQQPSASRTPELHSS